MIGLANRHASGGWHPCLLWQTAPFVGKEMDPSLRWGDDMGELSA